MRSCDGCRQTYNKPIHSQRFVRSNTQGKEDQKAMNEQTVSQHTFFRKNSANYERIVSSFASFG
jgi:hypothetical protein